MWEKGGKTGLFGLLKCVNEKMIKVDTGCLRQHSRFIIKSDGAKNQIPNVISIF